MPLQFLSLTARHTAPPSPITQQRLPFYSSISTPTTSPPNVCQILSTKATVRTKTLYTLTSSFAQGISDEAALKTVIVVGPKHPFERVVLKQSTASTTSYCTHLPRNTLSQYPNHYQHARCYLCFHCCPPLHKVKSTTTTEEARTIHCPTSCWCRFSLWECDYPRTPSI